MTMFRTVSGALMIYAGDPRPVHFPFFDAAGNPQSLSGRSFIFAVRREILTQTIFDPIPMTLSADGFYVTAPITAQQATAIFEAGREYAIVYDVIETTAGGSTTRWTGWIATQPSTALPHDAPPRWIDLPVAELVAEGATVRVSERGAAGPGVEQRLKDLGEIPEADPALMRDKIREWGGEGGEPFAQEAQAQAERATEFADVAVGFAGVASEQAGNANAARAGAEAAKQAAEVARDAALSNGTLYSTIAEGLAASSENQVFRVLKVNGKAIAIYRKVAGEAVYIDGFTSDDLVSPLVENIVISTTRPTGFGDAYGANMFDMSGGPNRRYPRAPGMQIGWAFITSQDGDTDLDGTYVRARGVKMGSGAVYDTGRSPFSVRDDYGATLIDMHGGPQGRALRTAGGFQFDGIYMGESSGDRFIVRDVYGAWRELAFIDQLPESGSSGGTFNDYAARDAINVAWSMAGRDEILPMVQPLERDTVYLLIGYGQSFDRGSAAYPSLTTGKPDYSDMHVYMLGDANRPAGQTTTTYDPLTSGDIKPLAAVAHINGVKQTNAQLEALGPDTSVPAEGHMISAAYWFRQQCLAHFGVSEAPDMPFVVMQCGVGGQPLAALLKGANPEYYNRILSGMDQVMAHPDFAGKKFRVLLVDFSHGQADYAAGASGAHNSVALYAGGVQQLRGQLNGDIALRIPDQKFPPAWFICQATGPFVTDATDLHVANAQLRLCTDVPGFFWAQPDYPVVNVPSGHPDNNGQRWRGQYHAICWGDVLLRNRRPAMVRARTATWSATSNELILDLIGSGPLEAGTPYEGFSPVSLTNLGLSARDSVGVIDLTDVRFVGAMTIAATLSRTPREAPVILGGTKLASNGYLGIMSRSRAVSAEHYTVIPNAGQHPSAAVPELIDKPYPLHIWCAAFSLIAEEI